MMQKYSKWLILLRISSCWLLTACDCYFQGSGLILNYQNQRPISEAQLVFHRDGANKDTLYTNSKGEFRYNDVAGNCDYKNLEINHPNFSSLNLKIENGFHDSIWLQPKERQRNELKVLGFQPDKVFTIDSFRSSNSANSSAKDSLMCDGWKLNEVEIRQVLASAKAITGQERHYYFAVLPCDLEGHILQGDQKYGLYLNGGAWIGISDSDSTWLFGNFERSLDHLFVMPVDRENAND